MKTVCIVGAGVIGCATAYQLARQGFQVVVLDAHAAPGEGASRANGAQLSYSYVEPLASPATLRALPGLLRKPDSPLRLRVRADWRQWLWGLQFLRACTAAQVQRGTRELLALARLSRHTLEAWMASEALDISFRRNGKLVLCADAQSLAHQARQVALQAGHGGHQQVLSRLECIEREPSLAESHTGFVGGVWTADECLADAHQLCQALARRAARDGAVFHHGVQARDFVLRRGRAQALRTSHGEVLADAYVIAAGERSPQLARSLGMVLPVYPVKGYSLTLAVRDAARAPRASVTHLGLKTVFAPLRDSLRVAAMAELTGHALDIPADRVQRMLASVQAMFPGACDLHETQPWAGLRPCTPDSLPRIGRTRVDNVFLNTGQGALGLTLAAGSAVVLGDLLAAARAQAGAAVVGPDGLQAVRERPRKPISQTSNASTPSGISANR